ncbi:MAG: heavy-metal-associated domain-containing protein [Oscillatoriales cyanobacterium RM1_1_9]|nr:heavy-metal-associated domain-containing protein [Oscillatoriales cyanobacterium SM2_3_0]NJO45501.1 heavy-metal-associated domain-containing protein [Oscillatoriales cyanobacterium RM2_1_1]NJO71900.1 heavy-metal-associated domain-containing protein [Oscillatoriales cyanobacterium RM1_1_9]
MTVQLKVPSMVCDGCVNTVTQAIKNLDSSATVEINLRTKQVMVEGKPSESEVKQAIVDVGHIIED